MMALSALTSAAWPSRPNTRFSPLLLVLPISILWRKQYMEPGRPSHPACDDRTLVVVEPGRSWAKSTFSGRERDPFRGVGDIAWNKALSFMAPPSEQSRLSPWLCSAVCSVSVAS
ncbi:MAG: hypothetical protein MZV63_41305 [Marinilabiliales bacterium]|nr:hypothetical protein [Marinilabiliales bacterium]